MLKQLDCYCWSCSFQWRVLWHNLPNIKESRKERNICFGLENIHIIFIFCRVFFAECIQKQIQQKICFFESYHPVMVANAGSDVCKKIGSLFLKGY